MRIPIGAAPYLHAARRFLLGPGSVESAAYRRDVLCAAARQTIRPAVFLPGQLERVTGTQTHFRVEDAIAAAVSTTITYGPTMAFHLKNVVLLDGSIYVGRHRHFIADKSLFGGDVREPEQLKTSALASSYMGTRYFGHWLRDDCAQYLLAQTMTPPLCLRRPEFPHQDDYQRYFGQEWNATDRAWIEQLIVLQDFAHNRLKQGRYRALRERIRAHFAADGRSRCVYLRRGNTGQPRPVANEKEILDRLVRHGFRILDIETDTLAHVIETLVNAELVVSIEGSHLAHCTFTCPEGSALLVLQPPDRFSATHRGWSESVGVRFGFVVGAKGSSGYCFSPSEILRTADMLLEIP